MFYTLGPAEDMYSF